MIALFLIPVYALINFYIIRRTIKWMSLCHSVFATRGFMLAYIVIYVLLAATIIFGAFLPTSPIQRVIKIISNWWLGVMMYIIFFIAMGDLIKIILRTLKVIPKEIYHSDKVFLATGAIVGACIIGMSIYGLINANIIRQADYTVTVDKTCEDQKLKIVLIADTHLGYSTGCREMRQMVTKVNAMEPDLICFAGDMFDNSYESLDDPDQLIEILSGLKSTYGTYAVMGNHDIEETILAGFTFGGGAKETPQDMKDFVEKCGMTLLQDKAVLVDDAFYVVGRRDEERPGNASNTRMSITDLTADLDKTKPILCIDHEPRELQKVADAGVDLDLCGHTHAGQVFPGTLFIKLLWENSWGYKQIDQMHNFVTSGIGVYGPDMRTGCDSEIMNITVDFKS